MTTKVSPYDIASMDENEFVKLNEKLVHDICKKIYSEKVKKETGLEYEDIAQIGKMGLLNAKRKFKAGYGFQFSTYAVPLIRGTILVHIRNSNKVSIPRPAREAYAKIVGAGLLNEDVEVITGALSMTSNQVKRALLLRNEVSSLDAPVAEELVGGTFGDFLTDNVSAADLAEGNVIIAEFLSTLSPAQYDVWQIFKDTNSGSQREISTKLGISQAQVSRTLNKIFLKAEAFGKTY